MLCRRHPPARRRNEPGLFATRAPVESRWTGRRPTPASIADIGCGRGTTTVRLGRQYPTATILAVDQSPALLAVTAGRMRDQKRAPHLVNADFHHLPDNLRDIDLAVAAFCLYHSPHPRRALAEIAQCLAPGGNAVITTKSADSYHELDALVAASKLDPDARNRASLYQSFHSDNAQPELDAAGLVLRHRLDQHHTFLFAGLAHLADYLTTCPKYQLPAELANDPVALAEALRRRLPDEPVAATSTVTYLVATRP